jgi:hypothetical protein
LFPRNVLDFAKIFFSIFGSFNRMVNIIHVTFSESHLKYFLEERKYQGPCEIQFLYLWNKNDDTFFQRTVL